jgi:thymidylate kinase
MKLVIIEGTDRTGKDTLVQALQEKYPNSQMIHWGYPQGETNEEKTDYQKMSFGYYMRDYKFKQKNDQLDLLIWNRSHIGEYVYGTIYRDSYPDTWIPDMEQTFLSDDNNITLVLLEADPEFIVKNDDGESYSNKLEDKKTEIAKFQEAFNNSIIINKLKIKVNEGDNYTDATSIFNLVDRTINL